MNSAPLLMSHMLYSDGRRITNLIISVGRITKNKHPDVIIEHFLKLPDHYQLLFCGSPITEEDKELQKRLMETYDHSRIEYQSFQPDDLRDIYRVAALILHASTTGLDKCVLEAMACGCLVVSCSPIFKNVLPEECVAAHPDVHF